MMTYRYQELLSVVVFCLVMASCSDQGEKQSELPVVIESNADQSTSEFVTDGNDDTSFQCGDSIVYQGAYYPTLFLGGNCWFAENLNSSSFNDGTPLYRAKSEEDWKHRRIGAASFYGDMFEDAHNYADQVKKILYPIVATSKDSLSLRKELASVESWERWDVLADSVISVLSGVGRLYNGYAVRNEKGLCPSGWHVSTEKDWKALLRDVGSFAGRKLKTSSGWAFDGGGTNDLGFNARAGGHRDVDGWYWGFEDGGYWYCEDYSDGEMRLVTMSAFDDEIEFLSDKKGFGLSVRCVLDR